tara:strand:+ start:64 stop:543 length:480 start_codon:yes stop_codon:yes gene_type:complete
MGDHIIQFSWGGNTFSEPVEDNLLLSELTPDAVREALNKAVGRYALYSGIMVRVRRKLRSEEDAFTVWEAARYTEVDRQEPKRTEGWKKAQLILLNQEEWQLKRKRVHDLSALSELVRSLVSSFDRQIDAMKTVLSYARSEVYATMQGDEVVGHGRLGE